MARRQNTTTQMARERSWTRSLRLARRWPKVPTDAAESTDGMERLTDVQLESLETAPTAKPAIQRAVQAAGWWP